MGMFSQAESISGDGGRGLREGIGRDSGARSGDEVIERIEGGGLGVEALGPLKKSAV
jgi:hypothetical protein